MRTENSWSSEEDAENNLQYLDGTSYKHIDGVIYNFQEDEYDETSSMCFRIVQDFKFKDTECKDKNINIICQYNCPSKYQTRKEK